MVNDRNAPYGHTTVKRKKDKSLIKKIIKKKNRQKQSRDECDITQNFKIILEPK